MQSIELLVSVPGRGEPILVTVPQGAQVVEVIEIVKGHGETGLVATEEIFLFLENGEEALEAEKHIDGEGIGHRHHVHVHRCRTVDVSVTSGGSEQSKPFAPSIRLEKVRDWAMNVFDVPTEKANYILADGQTPLNNEASLHVLAHHCHVHLSLVSSELVIHYTVNAEAQVSHERHCTPRLIIEKAELDPAKYYLKQGSVSYKGTPDQPILLREGEAFTAIYAGGGTVS